MSGLTAKQEKFCQAYMETGSNIEAYKAAYNTANMKDRTISVKACELMKNGNVTVRVKQLQEKAAKRNEITVDDLVRELEEARVMAATGDKPQTASMVAATLGKAKLLGLSVDKVDMTSNGKEMAQFTFTPVGKND